MVVDWAGKAPADRGFGEGVFGTSEASATALAGWKQVGVTRKLAGDRTGVAGGPVCQLMNGRLLLWTSSPSLNVAWTTSVPGTLPLV